MAAAGAVLLVLALLARQPRWAFAAALAAILNAAPLLTAGPAPAKAASDGPRLRVLSLNLLSQNYYTNRVGRFFRQTDADILVLQEVTSYWGEQLAGLHDLYPHAWPAPMPATNDVLVLSRHPLREAVTLDPPPGSIASPAERPVRVVVATPAGDLVVYGVHPETPRTPDRWQMRNRLLAWLAATVREHDEGRPVIVAGDFNTPPTSPFLTDLLRTTGLRDAAGRGVREPTRQPMLLAPYLAWLGAPVDHILVSPDIAVLGFTVGRYVWSDHLPVIADLAVGHASAASPAR